MSKATHPGRAAPALRRAYFDCRYGQLHCYLAIPAGGGFDEKTALLCIPGIAGCGALFQPLLTGLGQNRSVYAIDLAGCGMSDAPPGPVTAVQSAAAVIDLVGDLRLRRMNILAHTESATLVLSLVECTSTAVDTVAFMGAVPELQFPAGIKLAAADNAADAGALVAQLSQLFGN
jgi:pimeloyl-ACP methyl ester carboxylesterase